ncbi:MAG: pyruvate dehydrogenase E1 component subunit beta [Candidatus Phytoplasma cynodontis]|uniref:alpha-ketoacid dehydrogenase subunit beta n=1 Tax='Cynodon dactylon' phytoplasma TaxID=295320 RepID=UPI001265D672|nr:alpha-ketoacid dehydrogenase subunit beta ['Cynodon dactylon' phytoplasma]KAB8122048.1 alpha-ketoacid dehydrogenase subunit beta ['Cynodon dactylon' phytoplasma]WIA07536.1 MAG: pyruvate dehydrogenase E1 component subunit beta [Candidatus Phytoplasma cynodontis]
MALLNLLESIKHTLDLQLSKNDKIVLFGQDVGKLGGVFRLTAGLQQKYTEKRVFNTPICESTIVGSAIGMAMNGLRPIAEIQFDGFVYVGLQDLISHAARMRNRSRNNFFCPMVLKFPIGGGVKALEHHSESLEVVLGSFPGLKVVVPSNPYDAKGLLIAAINDDNPVIYMEPKILYRGVKEEVPEEEYEVEIGKAKVVQEGKDITLVAWSSAVNMAKEVIKQLDSEKSGISIELIDLISINPIDRETILNSVKKTGRFLVVHEATRTFGPAAELITLVNEYAFNYLKEAPKRVTGFDIIMPLARGEYHQMINKDKIVYCVKKNFNILKR